MKNLLKYKFINKLCIRVVNITIPAKDVRKKIRQQLQCIRLEDFKKNFSAKYPDYYQFVMFQPWGDFYIPCALFSEFKKQNNNAKILAVCVNNMQENVLKSFDSVDKIIKIPKEYYYSLFSIILPTNFKQELKKGKLYCLSHWLYKEAEQCKSMNFLELYTKMLELNYPTKLNVPSRTNITNINYSNTVLIYPESKSFDCAELTKNFWLELADNIDYLGFNVLFNTKKQKFGKYKTIFLPIDKSIEFAKQCKFVIGMRSGFSDILEINKVKNHIVIYPKSMYFKTITKEQQIKEFSRAFIMEENKTFEENMYRLTSLKMFNGNAQEFIYNRENQLNEEIINYIKENL